MTTPFAAVMVLFFAARLYSRMRPAMKLYRVDFFLPPARRPCSAAVADGGPQLTTLAVWLVSHGGIAPTGGCHLILLSSDVIARAMRIIFVTGTFLCYPNVLVKISTAVMLLRMKSSSAL